MKLKEVLKLKNINVGYLYFYIHLIVEVVCFYYITTLYGDNAYMWTLALMYDALAFVPQSIIGYLNDKFSKINFGIIGVVLLVIALLTTGLGISGKYLGVIILCLGNCFLHIDGAETTLKSSNGKLSHSAIFVGGGSFGVIIGKLLARINLSWIIILMLCLTIIPFILLAKTYPIEKDCKDFNYHSKKMLPWLIIILTVFVVIVRGYIGYGIPTSWNKTTFQTFMLFSIMGIGKCLGGIVADMIGVKKTALLSTILAIPFLLCGNNYMLVSLIGVMFFSMTMSITLAILVSVLKKTPGLAFGLTTIGLFLGTLPIFFFRFETALSNGIIVCILSLVCFTIFNFIIRSDKDV